MRGEGERVFFSQAGLMETFARGGGDGGTVRKVIGSPPCKKCACCFIASRWQSTPELFSLGFYFIFPCNLPRGDLSPD